MRNRKFTASLVLLTSICMVANGQMQSSVTSSVDEPTTGAISGKVVNESGQPVAGASLLVRTVNSIAAGRTAITDVDGNFSVNGLDRGLYTIFANTPAYTTAPADPNAPTTYYRIGDSVRLELVRGGVITGVVTNALGEPVVAVRVRATIVRDAKGEAPKMPSFGLEQATDDRGIYRMYGLIPGTYIVSAGGYGVTQSFQFNPYGSDVPTYAPSSTRDTAAEVSVRSGEESHVDIRYRGESGHTISGTVKIAGTSGATITLTPAGSTFLPAGNTFQAPGAKGFAFNGIADGEYDLVAIEAGSAQTAMTPMLSVSESKRVTVKGASVTGIELVPRPLGSISGRVVLETSKAPECQGKRAPLLSETLVQIRRPEKDSDKPGSPYMRPFGSSASPDPKGAFVLRNLAPGRYQFDPRFYARYWYLQSVRMGAVAPAAKPQAASSRTDAAANWTVLGSGDQRTNLTITLAEGAASVRGRLSLPAASSAKVLYLVPTEQDKAQDVLRFFVTEIAADGTFALNNLPPGRYWLIAQPAIDAQTATLSRLREPEAAPERTKLRRAAEAQKTEIELKPCQNLVDYQLPLK
jgi:Carboxypeptidase regulatory-like domain